MSKTLPAAILKLVKRTEIHYLLEDDGKTRQLDKDTKVPLTEAVPVPCKKDQVLDFVLRGNTLTVVTTDAQKISVELTDAQLATFEKSAGDAE